MLGAAGIQPFYRARDDGKSRFYASGEVEEFISACRTGGRCPDWTIDEELVGPETVATWWDVSPATARRLLEGGGVRAFVLARWEVQLAGGDARPAATARYSKREIEELLRSCRNTHERGKAKSLRAGRQLASLTTLSRTFEMDPQKVKRSLSRHGVEPYFLSDKKRGTVRYPLDEASKALATRSLGQDPGE